MAGFDLPRWLTRIKSDEEFQQARHKSWRISQELYDMSYWRKKGFDPLATTLIVPVNYVTTFVSTLVSAIYSRNPKIFVRGRHDRFYQFGDTMEDLLERFWDEQDLKAVFIEVIRDCILTGISWIECGFIDPNPKQFPQPEVGERSSMLEQVGDVLSAFLKGKPPKPEPEAEAPLATLGILDTHKAPGQFYCVRKSPYDVLWPTGFHSYASLPYLIIHERLRKEDFQADPHYTAKEFIQSTREPRHSPTRLQPVDFSNVKSNVGDSSASDLDVVDLYHIWDRREQSVTTVSKKSPLPHAGPDDWPYYADGFPVRPLMFNAIPDSPTEANPYPFGDVEPIIGQVLEKSNIRTAMVEHRRRANMVIFVQKSGTTQAEVSNYARASQALEVVPVSNIEAIKPAPQVEVPKAIFETEEAINSDLDRDSGLQLILADLSRAGQIDRATVAQIAQGNASLKTNYRVDRVEMFAKDVARYLAGLFWQYMTRDQVGELIGTTPDQNQWPALPEDPFIARQRIRQEIEFRIEAGSTRPIQDDVLDREQFLRYIRIFQAVAPQKFLQVENKLLALMARKFREPSLENVILSALSQDQVQEAQAENQLLLQGHPQLVRPTDDHEAHLAVHGQAAQSPVHKLQAEQMAAQGQVHPLDSHLLQHAQARQQSMGQGGQGHARSGNRQSVSQQSDAPSATEIARGGTPTGADLSGTSLNLGVGSGSESAGMTV